MAIIKIQSLENKAEAVCDYICELYFDRHIALSLSLFLSFFLSLSLSLYLSLSLTLSGNDDTNLDAVTPGILGTSSSFFPWVTDGDRVAVMCTVTCHVCSTMPMLTQSFEGIGIAQVPTVNRLYHLPLSDYQCNLWIIQSLSGMCSQAVLWTYNSLCLQHTLQWWT